MILRPLQLPEPADGHWLPAWQVVEKLQRQKYESCWMITQPSHAALAGEIAAKIRGPQIPKVDTDLIRAIALHDAGWGIPDAQAITRSRSQKRWTPKSFLEAEVAEFLDAWTQSIQVAQSIGAAGGYIVSRHFQRLAQHRASAATGSDPDLNELQAFVTHETQRQKRLVAKQSKSERELELLTDLLQLCDLLSLYICSGARKSVELPECFGFKLRLLVEEGGYQLDPALFEPREEFSFAALRYPAIKEVSSQEIRVIFISRSEGEQSS